MGQKQTLLTFDPALPRIETRSRNESVKNVLQWEECRLWQCLMPKNKAEPEKPQLRDHTHVIFLENNAVDLY